MIQTLLQQCAYDFPNPLQLEQQQQLDEHGLICVGGDLHASSLVYAYYHGMFPWFNQGEPIYWWSPDPRCIIIPADFVPSQSLVRQMKKHDWQIRIDHEFAQVIQNCALPRQYSADTWIGQSMIESYIALHQLGIAHSIEIWDQNELIGGLYGVNLGRGFFGESMFHRRTDASKMAFYALMRLTQAEQCPWVDCQLENAHLMSLGATLIPRRQFLHALHDVVRQAPIDWKNYHQRIFSTQDLAKYDCLGETEK